MNNCKVKLKDETVSVMADQAKLEDGVLAFYITVYIPVVGFGGTPLRVNTPEIVASFSDYESFYISEVLPGPVWVTQRESEISPDIGAIDGSLDTFKLSKVFISGFDNENYRVGDDLPSFSTGLGPGSGASLHVRRSRIVRIDEDIVTLKVLG